MTNRSPATSRLSLPLLLALSIGSLSQQASGHDNSNLGELFEERLSSLVVIEFFVETEIDRRPIVANAIAVDQDGLVLMAESSIPNWVPIEQLKEFKAYRPGQSNAHDAEYLGSDRVKGWHFARVEEALASALTPLNGYGNGAASIGKRVWGIGIADKNLDFTPYLLTAEVSAVEPLPDEFGFTTREVASPGSLVFFEDGSFAGWASNSLNFERYLTIEGKRYHSYIKIPDQTSTFITASTFFEYLESPPASPDANELSWIGLVGLEAIEDEVASVLGLEGQSAIAVSRVLDDSPAAQAGLQERDILVAMEGEAFPRFVPRSVAVRFFEQEVLKRRVGEKIELAFLRDGERRSLVIAVGEHPEMVRHAERSYFEELGLTVREFVVSDEISLRLDEGIVGESTVVVSFVRMNGNAHAGGLKVGDIIVEIDGEEISGYEDAVAKLEAIEADEGRSEFVALVARGPETAIVRIALK